MAAAVKYFCHIAVFLIFVAALYELYEGIPKNECIMTYMYELPEYIPVEVHSNLKNKNTSRFKLFLYGEGVYAHKLREYPEELDGIPVLFIPGNSGSYQQVRSLASVALRMGTHRNVMEHFNYFSIDFNEELYAFYGGALEEQTAFVHECIKSILSMYRKTTPNSVILVGHSMGGVLARAVFTLPDFDKSVVSLIITQATPHKAPILYTDYLPEFYRKVNVFWMQQREALKHVTLLSTGGGDRDTLVAYHLTTLDGLTSPHRSVSANTMSVPRAWISTDHLCAVWCNQMVKATVRAMYDMIDTNTKQITTDIGKRMKVLRHHFLYSPGTYRLITTSPSTLVSFKQNSEWDILDTDYIILDNYTAKLDKYFAFHLNNRITHMVLETNLVGKSWLFGCKTESADDSCTAGEDLSHIARLIPPDSKRVYAHLQHGILQKYTHIVLLIPKTKVPIFLSATMFNINTKTRQYQAPTAIDLLIDFPRSLYHHRDIVINRTNELSTYELVKIPSLVSLHQAYTAHVTILSCQSSAAPMSFMRLHTPWSKGTDIYGVISPSQGGGNLSVKLHMPSQFDREEDSIELHIYLQPGCQYKLEISIDFLGSIGQFARHYFFMLPAFVIANLFMVLCHQLFLVSRGQACPTIATAQDAYGQPWKVALITTLLELILCNTTVSAAMMSYGLPVSDGKILTDRNLMFPLLHLCLYSFAFVIVRVAAGIFSLAFVTSGTVMRFLFHRIFTHHTIPKIGSVVWWIVLIAGIYSSWHYCGSAGLLITYILIIGDIMSSMVTFAKADRRHSMWYMQQTMMMLTLCMFILSMPEFVSWLKNYKYGSCLKRDPSRYPSIVIATSLMLVHFSTDHENWYLSYMNSFTPVMLSIGALLFGVLNIWRLNVIIPTVFVWVASVQTLGIILHRNKTSSKSSNKKKQ